MKRHSKKNTVIKSSSQAQRAHDALTTTWSYESQLSQRILIYIASLLEGLQRSAVKRKPSKWNKHMANYLRAGKSMSEAARDWK